MGVLDFLKKTSQQTAADIAAAIEQVEAASIQAEAEVGTLTSARAKALLDSTDAEAERIEKELARAVREQDRADLVIGELKDRLVAQRQVEHLAELDRIFAEGMSAQAEAIRVIRAYGPLAQKIAVQLGRLMQLEATCADADQALSAANDPRRVMPPDPIARPRGPEHGHVESLWITVRLPALDDPHGFYWGGRRG